MIKGGSGAPRPRWLGRLVRALGLSASVSLGVVGGWQLGDWHDTGLSSAAVLDGPEGVLTGWLTTLEAPGGADQILRARMPEVGCQVSVARCQLGFASVPVHPVETGPTLLGVATLDPEDELLDAVGLLPASRASFEEPSAAIESAAHAPAPEPVAVLDPRDRPAMRRPVLDARDRSIVPPTNNLEPAPAPSAPVAVAAAMRPRSVEPGPNGSGFAYVVEPGDTLSEVSERFGVSLAALLAANDLELDSLVAVGQRVLVPRPGQAAPALAAPRNQNAPAPTPTPALARSQARPAQATPTPIPSPPLAKPTALASRPTPTPTPAPPVNAARPTPAPQAAAAPPVARLNVAPGPAPAAITQSSSATLPIGPLLWPVPGVVSQRFGPTHTGVDVAAAIGTPVKAAAAGTVVVAAKLSYGYGWRVIVDHGNGCTTLYAHLSAINVEAGARVGRGQVIGAVGSTGVSTGPHLHFEVSQGGARLDPLKYLP